MSAKYFRSYGFNKTQIKDGSNNMLESRISVK